VAQTPREDFEKAWWAVREELTNSKRFLVATRLFLQQKEVYQERAELEPVDVILLGKLLEAHALITVFLADRRLKMTVYEGQTGEVLWEHSLFVDTGTRLGAQIEEKAVRLTRAFVASIPYQGYLVKESAMEAPTFTEGDVRATYIEAGNNHGIQSDHSVQWIRIKKRNLKPLFQGGGETEVFAEGKVLRVDRQNILVEITRFQNLQDLKEFSLARFPEEDKRLQQTYSLQKDPDEQLLRQMTYPKPKAKEEVKNKSLVAALSFLGSFAVFLLLAL
jgi:hypothetical protein